MIKLPSSLAYTTLLSMGVRISIVITVAAYFSYLLIVQNLEQQTYDKLETYITERAHEESAIFKLAEDNHQIFRQAFLNLWPQRKTTESTERFETLFEPFSNDTYRLKQAFFDGQPRQHDSDSGYMGESRWISGFIGQNAPVEDNAFRNRLSLSYDLIDRFGEGWSNRFANTYVSLPEGVNIVYWPYLNWAKEVKPYLNILGEEWVYSVNKDNNPTRESVWTGLYYDQTADEWMVSCKTPIDDDNGQHLADIGHDILMNMLFQSVFDDHLEGAYNFIFRKDGRLIAHPLYTEQLEQSYGLLNISQIEQGDSNAYFQVIQQAVAKQADKPQIVTDSSAADVILAISPMSGPDWYFVTVYPKSLLLNPAMKTARVIFIIGLISLILELIMLYRVLIKNVIRPLAWFETASHAISCGIYDLKVALHNKELLHRQDEVGKLRTAFLKMADHIYDYNLNLEEKVRQRTKEAEQARQYAEEQAYTDYLTGLPNRRAFYEYGQYAFENARRHIHPLTAVMVDIDNFKTINDTYGHDIGDEVIKCLSQILKASIRPSDLTARLGGEEFVILLSETHLIGGINVAQKIRKKLDDQLLVTDEYSIHFTASFGVAELDSQYHELDTLLKAADKALYQAKTRGRNRVETWPVS